MTVPHRDTSMSSYPSIPDFLPAVKLGWLNFGHPRRGAIILRTVLFLSALPLVFKKGLLGSCIHPILMYTSFHDFYSSRYCRVAKEAVLWKLQWSYIQSPTARGCETLFKSMLATDLENSSDFTHFVRFSPILLAVIL